jgi:hypothetical protein
MNRWLVLEAFADNGQVRMQILNIHASATAAFWYWGRKGSEHRLFLFDLKTRRVHNWDAAHDLMVYEQLKRLQAGHKVAQEFRDYLIASQYISVLGAICPKGQALYDRIEPPPALRLVLNKVSSTTRSRLKG